MEEYTAVVLQHVPFEGLGSIEPWLINHRYKIEYVRFYESYSFPSLDAIDAIIVLGGPMSVNDESEYPWLREEKQFLHEAIVRGCPTLGICLGAQLLASVLGGRVTKNKEKEIGWYPIKLRKEGITVFHHVPEELPAFHWHGETFEIPRGAVHIASSAACTNQAFLVHDTVLALQFHLEATPSTVQALLEHCRDELVPGKYIQPEEIIVRTTEQMYRETNRYFNSILDSFFRKERFR